MWDLLSWRSNLCLLHWQVDSLLLSPQGGPTIITVDVSFSPLVLSGFALYVFQLCWLAHTHLQMLCLLGGLTLLSWHHSKLGSLISGPECRDFLAYIIYVLYFSLGTDKWIYRLRYLTDRNLIVLRVKFVYTFRLFFSRKTRKNRTGFV